MMLYVLVCQFWAQTMKASADHHMGRAATTVAQPFHSKGRGRGKGKGKGNGKGRYQGKCKDKGRYKGNMHSASFTGARSGDAHQTAREIPHWVQDWHDEYDQTRLAPREANSGKGKGNMHSASSTGARSGDAHQTAPEIPQWVHDWHDEYD